MKSKVESRIIFSREIVFFLPVAFCGDRETVLSCSVSNKTVHLFLIVFQLYSYKLSHNHDVDKIMIIFNLDQDKYVFIWHSSSLNKLNAEFSCDFYQRTINTFLQS